MIYDLIRHGMYQVLTNQEKAGWCAINPVDGLLYSSDHRVNPERPIYKYHVSVNTTPGDENVLLAPAGTLDLQSGGSAWNQLPSHSELGWQLKHMQGGVFSQWGHLYLVNGYGKNFDRYKGGIWVFAVEGDVATLYDHSNQEDQPGTFTFEFHPGDIWNRNEPEGIDIWDLDAAEYNYLDGPKGQIHVNMIDNFPDEPSNDDLYFKHYTTAQGDECRI